MSVYEELEQLVTCISDDAQDSAFELFKCSENIGKITKVFIRLTETTQGGSAKKVEHSFREAEKQLLNAAKALVEAAEAGHTWCGSPAPEHKLVLKPKRR